MVLQPTAPSCFPLGLVQQAPIATSASPPINYHCTACPTLSFSSQNVIKEAPFLGILAPIFIEIYENFDSEL